MSKRKLLCVILAAGKGTRMKSKLPKVLHPVAGIPMLGHVMRAARDLGPDQIVVVVGPGQEDVATYAAPHDTVLQAQQLGTGHAVRSALVGRDLTGTDVLVLFGDVPLVPMVDLSHLCDQHARAKSNVTIMAMIPDNPTGYGRLITTAKGEVTAIVEELDCTPPQRDIRLCWSGVMMFRSEGLNDQLARIENKNAKSEYYLTDMVTIAGADGGTCTYVVAGDAQDFQGVNDRSQLALVENRLQHKLRQLVMKNGATLIDPTTVYLSGDTQIGQDVVVEPNVFIGPEVIIENGVIIHANCYLEGVTLRTGAEIGPYVRIRPGTDVGQEAVIANFVEVKKSTFAAHAKVSQFCCVVDADIGAYANLGAGTIISNWDGVNKYRSHIDDFAFVGGNSTLVSPVKIGNSAFVTAGSVITEDVKPDEMAFGRARQVNKPTSDKAQLYSKKQKKKG
jgi:bifunctional UDP-N-acetylglucosamine pyrophosphorylase / glucosamine-1-phosphate N-acetyltransferase